MGRKLRPVDGLAAVGGILVFVSSFLNHGGTGSYSAWHELLINQLVVTDLLGLATAIVLILATLGLLPARIPWATLTVGASVVVLLNSIFSAVAFSQVLFFLAQAELTTSPGIGIGFYLAIVGAIVLLAGCTLAFVPALGRPLISADAVERRRQKAESKQAGAQGHPGPATGYQGQQAPGPFGPQAQGGYAPPAPAGPGQAGPSYPGASGERTQGGYPPPTSGQPFPDRQAAFPGPPQAFGSPQTPGTQTPGRQTPGERRQGGPDSGGPMAGERGPGGPGPGPGEPHPSGPGPGEQLPGGSPLGGPGPSGPVPGEPVPGERRPGDDRPTQGGDAAPVRPEPTPAWSSPSWSQGPGQPGQTQSDPSPPAPAWGERSEPQVTTPTPAPFAPFWAAVPSPRTVYHAQNPSAPVATLQPGTWYAMVASHASGGFVVQLPEGSHAVLVEITDLIRG